jgi:glucosamine--fructose-6-phosphate aminotransferase (isomerizing)
LINSPNLDTSVSPVSKAISNAIKQLHGGYALVIISVNEPDRIYCIRKGNPILVGLSDTIGMIASEESAFNGKVNNYILLDDENLCWLNRDYRTGKIIFTATCQTYQTVNNVFPSATVYSSTLGDFPHWTLKEIHEQPDSINRALTGGGRLLNESTVKLGGFERFASQLIRIQHLIILGCGTSYHAAMIAEHYFKDLCHFQSVQSFDGAEFNVNDFPRPQDPVKDKIGCIFLSQSGETQDLYRCIKIGKQHNAILIGVVNVVDSLIAREVDCGVYLNAGREVAVASTKSFTSQLTVLMLIAMWFSQNQPNNYLKRVKYMDDLHKLPKCVSETIALSAKICPDLVKYFDNFSSCFLLGKGTGEGIALEGALKIKEISYIHAEGYSASSLKHGPFALLQKDFPVIIIALDNDYFDKCLNAMEEILSRGACVIFITNKVLTAPIKATVVVQLPTNTKSIGDTLAIIPLQMLAYYLSISRGITPDFPRNLAKVVTVE